MRAPIGPPARAKQLPAEGKKKKYQFPGFSTRSTRFGDKVPSFPNSFFYFYLSYLSCSVLRILLSIFAWISYSWISQFLRQCARLLIFANPVLFCRIAILLKRALTKVRSIRSTCSLLMVMETTGETTTREVFKLCPSDVRRSALRIESADRSITEAGKKEKLEKCGRFLSTRINLDETRAAAREIRINRPCYTLR